ncbi:MAG: hypothetical protein ACFCD0_23805 [Gemmataceae bacterium]
MFKKRNTLDPVNDGNIPNSYKNARFACIKLRCDFALAQFYKCKELEMKYTLSLTTSLLLVLMAFGHPASAATYEVSIRPQKQEKYKSAKYRLWLPDGIKNIRAIIVRQHGCGRHGLDHANDLQWQALATRHHCALLGTDYLTKKACSDWFEPSNGSNRAFLTALKNLAAQSERPEIATVPWVLWGHSGGALWAMNMADRHPRRVLGVFARSMAIVDINPKALDIPMILNYGEREKKGRFQRVHQKSMESFSKNRPKGALWAIAVDPKSSHDCRNSRHLAIPFFDAILAEHTRKPNKASDSQRWRTKGWIGLANNTFDISPRTKLEKLPKLSHWLPNKAVAMAWQEYCKTGEVRDKTPPPVPTKLTANLESGQVKLNWAADIDLESGIKFFHVLRNGKKIATVGGMKTKGNRNGHFQIRNYGDEPEPTNPTMTFVDPKGQMGQTYQVIAENYAGLFSKKSQAVNAK